VAASVQGLRLGPQEWYSLCPISGMSHCPRPGDQKKLLTTCRTCPSPLHKAAGPLSVGRRGVSYPLVRSLTGLLSAAEGVEHYRSMKVAANSRYLLFPLKSTLGTNGSHLLS
jgi:hypothetical protein